MVGARYAEAEVIGTARAVARELAGSSDPVAKEAARLLREVLERLDRARGATTERLDTELEHVPAAVLVEIAAQITEVNEQLHEIFSTTRRNSPTVK